MPPPSRTAPARRATTVVVALITCLVLAACGAAAGDDGDAGTAGGSRLADVEPVESPKTYVGGSTALLNETALVPVTGDQTPTPSLPVTVTDAQGTQVEVTDVSRILPLDLTGTSSRVVYQLGLGDNIVGRDLSSGFAELADVPLVTQNGHHLNGEAILELNPSLIITDTSLGPWDVVLQMREAGIPVVVIDSKRSLENVDDLILEIADAVGLPEEGRELAEQTEREIDEVLAQIQDITPADGEKLRMVFLYVRGQSGVYYMFGTDSGADSLIEALGGVDVAAEIGWSGMRPVTDEGIIEAQPDLILMMTKGLDSVGGVDGLFEHLPALGLTPAGERRRIVDMSDTEILSFGPTSAAILEALAVAVYAPDAGTAAP